MFLSLSLKKKTKQKQQNACLSKGIVSFGLEHGPIHTFVLCTRALLQCLWHQSANKWDFLPRKVAQHSSFWPGREGWNQCRRGIFTVGGGECLADNGRFLQRWIFSTRCFKVTFWFPTWRSLSPLKGHESPSQKGHQQNCQVGFFFSQKNCEKPSWVIFLMNSSSEN